MFDMIPQLPCGLYLSEQKICDLQSGQEHMLNASAYRFLRLVDGHRSFTTICSLVAAQYTIQPEMLRRDMQQLVDTLNKHYLCNVRFSLVALVQMWQTLLIARILPQPHNYRFTPPPTHNPLILFLWMWTVVARVLAVPLISSIGLTFLFTMATHEFILLFPLFLGVCIAIISSITVHESAHLIMLRWRTKTCTGYVGSTGLTLRVLRPNLLPLPDELWVSLSGPLCPFIIGLFLGVVVHLSNTGTIITNIGDAIMILFLIHGLQLIIPNPDLMNILVAWQKQKQSTQLAKEEKSVS